jgi:hypothetical protein
VCRYSEVRLYAAQKSEVGNLLPDTLGRSLRTEDPLFQRQSASNQSHISRNQVMRCPTRSWRRGVAAIWQLGAQTKKVGRYSISPLVHVFVGSLKSSLRRISIKWSAHKNWNYSQHSSVQIKFKMNKTIKVTRSVDSCALSQFFITTSKRPLHPSKKGGTSHLINLKIRVTRKCREINYAEV